MERLRISSGRANAELEESALTAAFDEEGVCRLNWLARTRFLYFSGETEVVVLLKKVIL